MNSSQPPPLAKWRLLIAYAIGFMLNDFNDVIKSWLQLQFVKIYTHLIPMGRLFDIFIDVDYGYHVFTCILDQHWSIPLFHPITMGIKWNEKTNLCTTYCFRAFMLHEGEICSYVIIPSCHIGHIQLRSSILCHGKDARQSYIYTLYMYYYGVPFADICCLEFSLIATIFLFM